MLKQNDHVEVIRDKRIGIILNTKGRATTSGEESVDTCDVYFYDDKSKVESFTPEELQIVK